MRYILEFLALLGSVGAGIVRRDTHLHPLCRPSSRCTKTHKSDNGFYYKVNGHQLLIEFIDGSYFKLRCDSDRKYSSMSLDDSDMPAVPWPVTVELAVFNRCLIPHDTYQNALQAFNITVTKTLNLELPADSKLEVHHLRGLQITNLNIQPPQNPSKPLRSSFDFLDEVPGLRTLKLTDVVLEPEALNRLPTSLEILNIVHAGIPATERTLRNNTQHWLERLKSLQSVLLADSSTIVAQNPGEKFTLPSLSSLPNLESFSLYYMPLDSDRLANFLKKSTLTNLILKSCGLATLSRAMFEGARITKITLANNNLTSLPGEHEVTTHQRNFIRKVLRFEQHISIVFYTNLYYNNPGSPMGLFTPLKDSLQELDLSSNQLNYEAVRYSVNGLEKLEILKANKNPLGSFCGDSVLIKTHLSSELPASLLRLELRNTGATRICSDWIMADYQLMDIDLSHNNIKDITYSDLEMNRTARGTVRVKLTHNKFRKIDVTRDDYERCLRQANTPMPNDINIITRVPVELNLDKLECGCDAYWLREVQRNCSLLQLNSDVACLPEPTLRYTTHTTLLQYLPDEISCPYNGYCLPECTCENRPRDNATVVRCNGSLPEAPHWQLMAQTFPLALYVANGTLGAIPKVKLVELHAPNNNITELADGDIPDTLRVLDVRNNRISHISLAAAQLLGSLRARNENHSVYLSGNPLACKCADAAAFSHLKPVVLDWDSVQCVDMSLVSGKTERDLCPSSLPIVFGVLVPLLLLAACVIVYLLFQRIKQFMFRRDLCVDWILRDNHDVDEPEKEADVFLSYAHPDLKQLKELKYGLEKLGYSTIEHQNDWHPGDSVLEQITSSVLKARRTLLLVSDNFAKSEWTPVEFLIAHQHALKTRTKRVLIVRCGLTKPEKLPLDLRIYLEKHTYLDWDTPKFWHLLRRFMPPPRQNSAHIKPDDLDPPSTLMQQHFPLLEKNPKMPQLAIPLPSDTVPSAC